MRLADVQHEIRTGDIFLFRGGGFTSRFIRAWTSSRYSHAGVAIWVPANGYSRLCVMEALYATGIRLFPLDLYVTERGWQTDWFAVTDPTINREAVASYLLKQLGKQYVSWRQMLLSFGGITRLVRKVLRLPADPDLDPDRFFCSQLCAAALRYAGFTPSQDDSVNGLPVVRDDPGSLSYLSCLQRRGSLTP